jgi:hypothetical protein
MGLRSPRVEGACVGHTLPLSSPPVLLLIFNRPSLTQAVVNAVRRAQPPRLYVAADGPRTSESEDLTRCEQARHIATDVNWDCDVNTLFRDENLGCRLAVSEAIDWFFRQESAGIILEDDCVPDPSFFAYSSELLDRYSEDDRVLAIAGNGAHSWAEPRRHSYVFSRYNHVWGWASWSRAWSLYDRDMHAWPVLRESDWLLRLGGTRHFARYWSEIFDLAYAGEVDSWAYRWTFSCWRADGLTALPSRNIVKNIGFGHDSTHTHDPDDWVSQLPLESLSMPLQHPSDVVRDQKVDRWIDHEVFGVGRFRRTRSLARRLSRRTSLTTPRDSRSAAT